MEWRNRRLRGGKNYVLVRKFMRKLRTEWLVGSRGWGLRESLIWFLFAHKQHPHVYQQCIRRIRKQTHVEDEVERKAIDLISPANTNKFIFFAILAKRCFRFRFRITVHWALAGNWTLRNDSARPFWKLVRANSKPTNLKVCVVSAAAVASSSSKIATLNCTHSINFSQSNQSALLLFTLKY